MSIPSELVFANEAAFTHDFLIPLLQRLGYAIVFNYHGTTEFGKDIVFGEIDRFGHVVYHGLQAKYLSSITLALARDLIEDAKQAFASTFKHPQTGNEERITTFYAVNGGSIAEQARQLFFTSLQQHAGQVRLIDGLGLIALNKQATFRFGEAAIERLNALIREIQMNRRVIGVILPGLGLYVNDPDKESFPMSKLRLAAVDGYLERPILNDGKLFDLVESYWDLTTAMNEIVQSIGGAVVGGNYRQGRFSGAQDCVRLLDPIGMQIENAAKQVLNNLQPTIII